MDANEILNKIWEILESRLRESLDGGMSQDRIAKTIGVSQNAISMWLKGENRQNVRMINVLRMLDALGVSMNQIAETIFRPDQVAAGLRMLQENPEAFDKVNDIIRAGGTHYESLVKMIEMIHSTLPDKQ